MHDARGYYGIRDGEMRFAHELTEHRVALVHGHSSHHVKPPRFTTII